MTRNAASKCNNKYLSASKSCVRKNYADLTCIHYEVQGQGSDGIKKNSMSWVKVELCAAMLRSKGRLRLESAIRGKS